LTMFRFGRPTGALKDCNGHWAGARPHCLECIVGPVAAFPYSDPAAKVIAITTVTKWE